MGYKVRVQEPKPRRGPRLKRVYGTGREGKGAPYTTRAGAEKLSKRLRRLYPARGGFEIDVIRS